MLDGSMSPPFCVALIVHLWNLDVFAAGAVLVVLSFGLSLSICIAAVALGEQPAASDRWPLKAT